MPSREASGDGRRGAEKALGRERERESHREREREREGHKDVHRTKGATPPPTPAQEGDGERGARKSGDGWSWGVEGWMGAPGGGAWRRWWIAVVVSGGVQLVAAFYLSVVHQRGAVDVVRCV